MYFLILAKFTKIINPIYELLNATKQPHIEANDKVNDKKTNQFIGTVFI